MQPPATRRLLMGREKGMGGVEMATIEMTADKFNDIIQNNEIVFIDYWADWCRPCMIFKPIFEKASEKHPDIVFAKCDTEKEMELAAAFQIRSIPTLQIFRDGILLFSQPGALPEEVLEDLITKVKELDMDDVRRQIEEAEKKEAQANSN